MMKDRTLLRRFGAMTMAFMLTLSLMATPAFAATGDGTGETAREISREADDGISDVCNVGNGNTTIRVDNAVPKAEYKLYKLLELAAATEEKDGKTVIAAYRYYYDAALKDAVNAVVGMDAFKYVPKAGDKDTDPRHGYGFKVDGDNVVFLTPANDGAEDAAVKVMMSAFADELRKQAVDTGKLTVKSGEETVDSTKVGIANASGLRMPDTGGIGTTVFYIGGAVLVLAAGVLLVVKKRAVRSED